MARTACLVCFISTVNGHCNEKKKKLTLGRLALVAGTQQILSNLFWDFWYLWKGHSSSYTHTHREREREREQTCTFTLLHALDHLAWVYQQWNVKRISCM